MNSSFSESYKQAGVDIEILFQILYFNQIVTHYASPPSIFSFTFIQQAA